jgi:hypothetical protein
MKKLIHLRKLSAQEINSIIKKQHVGYDLSENHKVDKDVLLIKKSVSLVSLKRYL